MRRARIGKWARAALTVILCLAQSGLAQNQTREQRPRSRRSERVRMERIEVASPNGKVKLTLLPNAERLTFTVTRGETTVIEPSTIVMKLDGYDLSSGVVLGNVERYEIDETYPWHGVHSTAVNRCNGARVSLQHDLSFTDYVLEVRVFDNGAAFRHVIAGGEGDSRVPDEYTTFVVPAGSTVWHHDLGGHYEAAYDKSEVSQIPAGQWVGPPMTFKLPGAAGYASIAEANLVDYAGMALEADGRRGFVTGLGHRQPLNYPYELRYGREEAKRLATPAAVSGTITTPWRVVMATADLNALVNCDILSNVCPPADPTYFPQGMNTPWVEPGLCVWNYVDRNYVEGGGSNSFENMKEFSRMAGQIGATYHILEGFAYRWSDEQIEEFVDYSKQQGVRVLFWRHSRDLRTPEMREEFFARLHRLGVAGAKIDFLDHEAKETMDQYEALLRKAAEYQCVIDFHGANKPTGLLRTWPNEMIKEAVRGMESSSLRERARHECVLPFTRYLAGPCDYTTMIFTERRRDSTWAHQIAALATFQSPILTIAAHPQSILDNPALEVIKSIPAVWDETVVLGDSRIGALSIFARRKGDMWMLAVMHAGPAETIDVPLSFLGKGSYQASLARDHQDNPAAVVLENGSVTRGDTITIELADGGGFVGRFTKQ